MNRKEAAELSPFIKAFGEGRIIEFSSITDVSKAWREVTDFPIGMIKNFKFRIKPESKFRPFKNVDECWLEMLKHQPFGWVIKRTNKRLYNIQSVHMDGNVLYIRSSYVEFGKAFDDYVFADGTPFGVTIDEEKLWRL